MIYMDMGTWIWVISLHHHNNTVRQFRLRECPRTLAVQMYAGLACCIEPIITTVEGTSTVSQWLPTEMKG